MSDKIWDLIGRIYLFIIKIIAYIKKLIYKVFTKSLYEQAIRKFETPKDLMFKKVKSVKDFNNLNSDDKKRFKNYIVGLKCFKEMVERGSYTGGRLRSYAANIKSILSHNSLLKFDRTNFNRDFFYKKTNGERCRRDNCLEIL